MFAGIQGRQVFARVMNPQLVKATAPATPVQAEKIPEPVITLSE